MAKTIAPQLAASYRTPVYSAGSLPNSGVSGSAGPYSTYQPLPSYSPSSYNYTVPMTRAPTNVAQTATWLSDLYGQERQAGIQRNQERRDAVLAGYDQRVANNRLASDRNVQDVSQFGDSYRQDLASQYQQNLAKTRQSAMKRGIGNTTVQDTLNRGVTSDYDQGRLRLEDSLLQNRLGVSAQNNAYENALTGDRLQFLTNIEDQYPSVSDVSNLYLQAATENQSAAQTKKAQEAAKQAARDAKRDAMTAEMDLAAKNSQPYVPATNWEQWNFHNRGQ